MSLTTSLFYQPLHFNNEKNLNPPSWDNLEHSVFHPVNVGAQLDWTAQGGEAGLHFMLESPYLITIRQPDFVEHLNTSLNEINISNNQEC